MSGGRHFLGPYRVVHAISDQRKDEFHIYTDHSSAAYADLHIAAIDTRIGPRGALATARLVAAAPDLLAAAEMVLQDRDSLDSGNGPLWHWDDVERTLRAAVAEAKGIQP